MTSDAILVISAYRARGFSYLKRLLVQISGLCPQIIVVNDDSSCGTEVRREGSTLVIERPNTGMNIGAWSAAIPYLKDYQIAIFIQDECFIKKDTFVSAYLDKLSQVGVGMVGESINPKWNKSWRLMEDSPLNYAFEAENGSSVRRVDYYRTKMVNWRICPGESAAHLRALAWGFSVETLIKINDFPIGTGKEGCIAAEIAVSKKVEQIGLRVEQIDSEHFKYFGHVEWRPDGLSKK